MKDLSAFEKFRNRPEAEKEGMKSSGKSKGFGDGLSDSDHKMLEEVADLLGGMSEKERDALFGHLMTEFQKEIKIKPADWTELHPFGIRCGSDKYYANLVNRLMAEVSVLNFPADMPVGCLYQICMSAAAYLEDIVSGLGVWDAFRSLYRKTYGTWLPFYDCSHDDYLTDNVNVEDIRFLAWQAFCRLGQPDDVIYSPLSMAVDRISDIICPILEEEFETAPEARRLRDALVKTLRNGDLYEIKEWAYWLRADSQILSSPNLRGWEQELSEKILSMPDIPDKQAAFHQMRSQDTWQACGPLGCLPSVYLAEMCRARDFDETARKLDSFQVIEHGKFEVMGADSRYLKVKDAAGTEFKIRTDSFKKHSVPTDCKGYEASIMKYGDDWHLNGMGVFMKDSPLPGEVGVTYSTQKRRELIDSVVASNRGRRIFYCRTREEVAAVLGIPLKKAEVEDPDAPGNYVLMLSDEAGTVIMADAAEFFKDPKNPFYNKEEARDWSMKVVMEGVVPDDIAAIIQEKRLLPEANIHMTQGKRLGKSVVQDNIRFLFAFYRTKNPSLDFFDDEEPEDLGDE